MALQVVSISLNNRVQDIEDKLDTAIARLETGNEAAATEVTLAAQRADIATLKADTALIKADVDEIRADIDFIRIATQSTDTTMLQDGTAVSRLDRDVVGTSKGRGVFGADGGDVARLLLTDEFGRTSANDMRTHDLLEQMLTQMLVMNAHFSEMTGAEINADDVEID